ncbi:MAG: hypothetical protein C5B52_03815 [Bacteroidetes bacterium]|nr:MAG: hypothetical protein C5B52_03815 [Bacteroidota bacterium]
MRFSAQIGVIAVIVVIIGCFLPWIEIPVLQKTLTGMDPQGTNFGRPGKLHLFFCAFALIFFIIPRIWAKRANWFFCAFALAWAIRNYIIYARCEIGTCPERKYGIYLVLIGSLVMMIVSFFPDLKIPVNKETESETK